MRQKEPHGGANRAHSKAFTLIEVITVLIILGILAMVIVPRALRPSLAAPRAAEVASQLRYLQLRALKDRTATWGMKCDSVNKVYWGFNGTSPDANATQVVLPGENGVFVSLAGKNMAMTGFTVIFDQYGIPYSPDNATKLANPLNITVTEGGGSATITITPETGFIP